MKNGLTRFLCRVLIVLMAWTPFHLAHAQMIGTEAVVGTTAQADRASVLAIVNRADMSRELQAYGLDSKTANDRIAALSDDELRSLAGKLNAVPAGADAAGGFLLLLLILVLWLVYWRK